MDSRFDEQDKRFNNRFHEQEKRFKEMDSCFEAFQERKTGELEGIATEAGERRYTPPEPQRQKPLLPSQPPWLLPQPPMMPQSSMSQPPPPPSQPPPLQHYQSPLHQSRRLPSSPFSAGRKQLHSASSMIGTSNRRSPAGAGARGVVLAEYEVEKRTCSTGQQLDRDQVLLMIRARYDNLRRQRNKRGGRRDAGHAFISDAGSSGKTGGRSTPRGARNRGGSGRGGRGGRGGNGGEKKRRMTKRQTSMPATETSTAVKEATQGVTVVVRSATKRCDASDRCVAFAAERAIRRKYAPTSSPSLPAKRTRVAATVTGFSAEKSRMP